MNLEKKEKENNIMIQELKEELKKQNNIFKNILIQK